MTLDLVLALALYALVTSITPGPNNIMLMTSGVNFGFTRTLPHMLGVGTGFVVMILAVGLGLSGIFDTWPIMHDILRGLSITYLVWLAWKIASQPTGRDEMQRAAKPMTFLQAAAFQWVNPKAWTMAVTAITAYAPDQAFSTVLWVALVFGVINLPATGSWTLIGLNIARFLASPAKLRTFNIAMAVLLVASLYPVLNP